jgi:hypothetical protein
MVTLILVVMLVPISLTSLGRSWEEQSIGWGLSAVFV